MMFNIIFITEIKDRKLIRLTVKQWKHIVHRHPEIINKLILIESTLKSFDYIKYSEHNTRKYYKYLKEINKYVMVAVKILNGDGFIMTAYLTRKIQK